MKQFKSRIYCSICGKNKRAIDFQKVKDKRSGLSTYCKECLRILTLQWKLNNTGRVREYGKKYFKNLPAERKRLYSRRYRLKNYGLTLERYDQLLSGQKGKCKICKSPPNGPGKVLHVDHCHKTKKVRGLLCSDCNTGLGKFRDNPRLLKIARDYIRHNK